MNTVFGAIQKSAATGGILDLLKAGLSFGNGKDQLKRRRAISLKSFFYAMTTYHNT
jgi:hypothetical protein